MPERTNEKQQVIEMLQALVASPDSEVTPSKMLVHAAVGLREVDVVVRTRDAECDHYACFEVVDRGRKATVEWAEQVIKKHEGLPTNELYLVAWQGFTAGALRLIDHEGGWVKAVVPQTMEGTPRLTTQELFPTIGWIAFEVTGPDGAVRTEEANPQRSIDLHAPDGTFLGAAAQLGYWYLKNGELWQLALEALEDEPRRHEPMWADLTLLATSLPVRMAIGLEYREQVLTLDARSFESDRFGFATADIAGQPRVVVALLDDTSRATRWLVQPNRSPAKKP